jgi:pimeloyl-ACP methyl ester carboxylesterase
VLKLNSLPHTTSTITNRHGLEVFVRFNGETSDKPLALVAHGLSDVHDSPTMRATTSALIEAGYNVLTYDATHSWGRSGGSLAKATLSHAYEDMQDVANWAAGQPWFQEPFVIAGHSLGGAAALSYAADHPERVSRVILIAPVVAGKLTARQINPVIRFMWRLTGRLPLPGNYRQHFGYDLLKDGLSYDGRRLAPGFRVPVITIVGTHDKSTPSSQARLLVDELPSVWRHYMVIPGADHGFGDHLDDLEAAVKAAVWLQ